MTKGSQSTERKTVFRRAAENQQVQVLFHALGGAGLGLLLAPTLDRGPQMIVGVVLLSAAILGHWYAILSDPARKHRGK